MKLTIREEDNLKDENEEISMIFYFIPIIAFIFSFILLSFLKPLVIKLMEIVKILDQNSSLPYYVYNIANILFSIFISSLLGMLLPKSLKIYNFLFLFSLVGIVVLFIIILISFGPLKGVFSSINDQFNKVGYKFSTFWCDIRSLWEPEISEECLPKDLRKSGEYKNIKISFEDQNLGTNPIPKAGESYNLRLFLKNQNVPPQENQRQFLGRYDYDVKIKKIDVIASPNDFQNKNYENYLIKVATFEPDNENGLILRAGDMVRPITVKFSKLPSQCKGYIYFKAIVTTEQLSRGKSILLALPNYDRYENLDQEIENEIKKFSSKTLFSPGPIDVIVYSQPIIVTKDESNYFDILVSLENKKEGSAILNELSLMIQRDYINIDDCTDSFNKKLEYQTCSSKDSSVCIRFKFDDYELTRKNSYNIQCHAHIDKNKYKETERESFIAADVSYLYNFEEYKYFKAEGCLKLPTQSQAPIYTTQECESPAVCYKYECPEGYKQISGKCNIVDSVCCISSENVYESSLVLWHPLAGRGYFTSCFGWRTEKYFHSGIDLGVVSGTSVYAVNDGTVVRADYDQSGFGNVVIIEHKFNGEKYYSLYGHLKCGGIAVKNGQNVKAGDIIGYSGGNDDCKGTSTGAHLHFEIRKGSNSVQNSINPCLYLSDCGTCKETAETCQTYKQYQKVDSNSGNCDDPLTN